MDKSYTSGISIARISNIVWVNLTISLISLSISESGSYIIYNI